MSVENGYTQLTSMQMVSVSLGRAALPEVRQAVGHAHRYPGHDPRIMFSVRAGKQRVCWECPECLEASHDHE